jgi:fructose-1,6-bisphosphatase/inositol monophosphatase family enzyme
LQRVFVVDPIDGTRAYVAGRKDWCVSIGLVEDGVPVAGVLAAPARDEIWQARLGGGAFLNDLRLGTATDRGHARALKVVLPDVVAESMLPMLRPGSRSCPAGRRWRCGLRRWREAISMASISGRGRMNGTWLQPMSC